MTEQACKLISKKRVERDMKSQLCVKSVVLGLGLVVGVLCTSCAGMQTVSSVSAVQASPSTESHALSEKCSIAVINDWDGSAGPGTRQGAVDEIIAGLKRDLASLPAVADRDFPDVAPDDNPVIIAASIRSLEAIRSEVPRAEKGIEIDASLEVTARSVSGQVIGQAIIQKAGAAVEGYRVEMYKAYGWVSDDPSCE